LALVLAWPSLAQAEWRKAQTDRFVIYGEGREDELRALAIKLTTFDALLRVMNPAAGKDLPPRRFEVYLARDHNGLRAVRPRLGDGTVGFYTANPDAVFAMAQVRSGALDAEEVLFHEYAHHFMLENFPAAYPAWFVEGWAEYYMTTQIKFRQVTVGGYNENRTYWLFIAQWLPLETMLSKAIWQIEPSERHIFYSQAWLLMHYLRTDETRAQQLDKAITAIAAGADPVKALQDATGMDMKALTSALRKYHKLPMYKFPDFALDEPQVTISPMPASADDFLLIGLRLAGADPRQPDLALLADVRRRAARWPGDRLAELTQARVEFLYGDVAAGEAIVKRLLDLDPKDVEVLLLAGNGQIAASLREGADQVARLRKARSHLIQAYKLDNTDYRILLAYTFSRQLEPGYPNANDLNALLQARGLAPSVQQSSVLAGAALLKLGRREQAVKLLSIVGNDPHGGPLSAQARALMAGKSLEEAAQVAAAEDDAPPPSQPSAPKAGKTAS
jgi:tetratricopeptide (TPR) repeat protein